MESEHLMLSILKNKENIATQILNQYDVDYEHFKNELGMVRRMIRAANTLKTTMKNLKMKETRLFIATTSKKSRQVMQKAKRLC